MPITPESLPPRVRFNSLVATLVRRGWPLTKGAYLHLMYGGANEPEFPLHAEVLADVPEELEGPLPTNSAEYWAALDALNAKPATSRNRRSPRR